MEIRRDFIDREIEKLSLALREMLSKLIGQKAQSPADFKQELSDLAELIYEKDAPHLYEQLGDLYYELINGDNPSNKNDENRKAAIDAYKKALTLSTNALSFRVVERLRQLEADSGPSS